MRFRFGVIDFERTIGDTKRFQGQMIKWYAFFKLPGLLYISSCTLFSYFFRKVPFLKKYEELGTRLDRAIYDLFELIDNRVEIYKGAKRVSEELCESGVKLFVTTGGTKSKTEKKLREWGMLQLFELVLGADILPKLEHIPYFIREMGLESEQSFYLGDSVYDMYLAEIYGIYGVGITNTVGEEDLTKAGAKQIITNWQELKKIL